jgi:predicted  nucleic acid-binding Zn-ribbon protein
LEEELTTLKDQLEGNRRRRRELETESDDLANRRTINQTRQLKAKNNDEYRAVLKEADTIASQLTAREDELLRLMEEAEKLEESLPGLEKATAAEAAAFKTNSKSIEKEMASCQKLEKEALAERVRLTETLPADALGRYRIVAKNRDGQAMAPVSGGLCQVCRLSVPPQLFNELQRNDKLLSCPNCARIIYWPDHPDLRPEEETPDDPTVTKAHG